MSSNHLPAALSAAGIACLFASIYAAHGLYGLLPSGLAFLLLAVTAFAGVGLSLLQGPFLAGLGLLGGFLTPLIVQSATPAALPLFALVTAVTLAKSGKAAGVIGWALLVIVALTVVGGALNVLFTDLPPAPVEAPAAPEH